MTRITFKYLPLNILNKPNQAAAAHKQTPNPNTNHPKPVSPTILTLAWLWTWQPQPLQNITAAATKSPKSHHKSPKTRESHHPSPCTTLNPRALTPSKHNTYSHNWSKNPTFQTNPKQKTKNYPLHHQNAQP